MEFSQLAHKLLLELPPELAHDVGKFSMELELLSPGRFKTEESKIDLFGFELDNPLGLAAGFDKNGTLVNQVPEYGFSWDEVGSITYHGGKGNAKPRLFRLGGGLLNRMGLNGDPAYDVVERLKLARNPFAVNIAKTHDPNIMGEKAIEDMIKTYDLVVDGLESLDKLIYTVFNISCPNTREGKTFEKDYGSLKELLDEANRIKQERPLLIKTSPNLSDGEIRSLVEAVDDKVDGYVIGNTLPYENERHGKGGLSGRELTPYAGSSISKVRDISDKTIIGCGGVMTGLDAKFLLSLGADAVQAFTGFVYNSPHSGTNFAHKINESLSGL